MSTYPVSSAAAATVEPADYSEIFDPAEALDRVGDDLELLAELADVFAEHRDRLLCELTAAVEARDVEAMSHAAHALKGSISTFSTKRPYGNARELELTAKSGRLDDAPLLLNALKASLVALENAVKSYLSSNR